jgi:hypothetical protein
VQDRSELERLKVVGTPQTVEVDETGTVRGNWLGLYTDETASAINWKFNITLPRRNGEPK